MEEQIEKEKNKNIYLLNIEKEKIFLKNYIWRGKT